MTEIIKLHDGELEVIYDCIMELMNDKYTAERYVDAIRELRDRAKALVESVIRTDTDWEEAIPTVDEAKLESLCEILP